MCHRITRNRKSMSTHKIGLSHPVNIPDTLYSGQSFMWRNPLGGDRVHASVIDGKILMLSQITAEVVELEFEGDRIDGRDAEGFIHNYFSLDVDLHGVFPERFRTRYPELWNLLQPYLALRVLRQDPFEAMVTFMCAQGIGMHLIRRQVSMIAERFGTEVTLETGNGPLRMHALPSPQVLAAADPIELARCTNNNRIRAENIVSMARAFLSGSPALACVGSGECTLDSLRDALCLHRGIGMKIADCIALFGLGRFDAFPIDTHVQQYLREWFGIDAARKSLTEKNYRYLQEAARDILGGRYTGYAGHILFHCWRKEVKRMSAF